VALVTVFKWQPLRDTLGIPDTRHLGVASGVKLPARPPSVLLANKPPLGKSGGA
jgi:hypothetical protein